MKVYCPALASGKFFPAKCAHRKTPGGRNVSPPIAWSDVPSDTKSFVVSIIDRHAVSEFRVHWYVIDIPPTFREIPEGASGTRTKMPAGCTELRSTSGEIGYSGPDPQRGTGPHEYAITVYALNEANLSLGPYSSLFDCTVALDGKVLASGTTIGVLEVRT